MRRLVPDTSVMVPAFFPERLVVSGNDFDLSARARPVANAIRTRDVEAFAPDMLLAEFLSTAAAKAFARSGGDAVDAQDVTDQVLGFFSLRIITVPAEQISAIALDLIMSDRVSPPDSWFLATAIHTGAELWYSHRHRDGIVEQAEKLHRDQVFVLTERKFS